MWIFHSLWIVFLETSRLFDLSSRNLGHGMFSFAERQDAERQEVWGHIWDNMRSGPRTRVHRWNQTPTWKTLQGTHQPDHTNRCWWPLQCHRTLCFTWQHPSANQRATVDQKKSDRSYIHKEKRPINEPLTGIPAAPDLPPAPASWAVPAKENITWPRLLVERSKRREVSGNTIQSEWKNHISISWILDPITLFPI